MNDNTKPDSLGSETAGNKQYEDNEITKYNQKQ